MTYDSRPDTLAHSQRVGELMVQLAKERPRRSLRCSAWNGGTGAMTPERSRMIGRRWAIAAAVLLAARVLLAMLGFDALATPLAVFAMICFYVTGEKSGWADGYKAAIADKADEISFSARESGTPLPSGNNGEA